MFGNKFKLLLLVFAIVSFSSCKESNTVTDIDGNVYKTIKIGNQVWMAENLKVTKYRNGNPILQIKDNRAWSSTKDGAYCSYNNDASNVNTYGQLYNWYALSDPRGLAPEGWHIPTNEEIAKLIGYLKGDTVAAGKMKVAGTEHWLRPNAGAGNESGFSALPGGYRFGDDGTFHTAGSNGYWWSTTSSYEMFSWTPRLYNLFADVTRDGKYMAYGLSVRCVKD